MYYKGAVLYYSGPDVCSTADVLCYRGPRCITRDEQYRGHDVLKWMFCITTGSQCTILPGILFDYRGRDELQGMFYICR